MDRAGVCHLCGHRLCVAKQGRMIKSMLFISVTLALFICYIVYKNVSQYEISVDSVQPVNFMFECLKVLPGVLVLK